MGVKRQADSKKMSVCMRIARFLTSESCQKERFNAVSWGPTNLNVMELPEVLNHRGLKALREQNVYAQEQKPCPSNWFSQVAYIATNINKNSSDAELQEVLSSYASNIEDLKG